MSLNDLFKTNIKMVATYSYCYSTGSECQYNIYYVSG